MTTPPPDVEFSYGVPRDQVPRQSLMSHWVACALAVARRSGGIGIRLVDSDEGRALNAQYRRKDYATNVLSFPAEVPEGVPVELLGDLILCSPVIAAEAADQQKQEDHHWAHMIIHGVLHLCGYDHVEPAQALEMENLERRALGDLGFPDPYEID